MVGNDDQLAKRFRGNMDRINRLVQLLFSSDLLKKPSVFGPSTGPRADLLRAIVVFLHANFEVAFRCRLPRTAGNLSFYSRQDFDKALKRIGVDVAPFRPLYPPLTQMAKRRKEIVHDADLGGDNEPHGWSIADDWQLIMWLMAVPAFYYQLRISLGLANEHGPPSSVSNWRCTRKYSALLVAATFAGAHLEVVSLLTDIYFSRVARL